MMTTSAEHIPNLDVKLDHEKLDVYQLALRYCAWTQDLIDELDKKNRYRGRHIKDHIDRASLSILLNTAEGNGKRQKQTRSKFFDDARGSATECSACLDSLVAIRCCPLGRVKEGKMMLLRIVSMLTKLVQLFSSD
ncbi:MAG: four helix bundle protein [Planctomycetaceae bacterium]|nr:four helix bundle protein [Planctomycetaceae bacterium]